MLLFPILFQSVHHRKGKYWKEFTIIPASPVRIVILEGVRIEKQVCHSLHLVLKDCQSLKLVWSGSQSHSRPQDTNPALGHQSCPRAGLVPLGWNNFLILHSPPWGIGSILLARWKDYQSFRLQKKKWGGNQKILNSIFSHNLLLLILNSRFSQMELNFEA